MENNEKQADRLPKKYHGGTEHPEAVRGRKRRLSGVVVSDKMDKTIIVQVTRRYKHPLYKKYLSRRKRFMAHDERNTCAVGDKVIIREARPLSKNKRWTLQEILKKAI